MTGLSAAILAGGLGTRLRSVTGDQPKVLAPVGGRPFLARLLDQLANAGLSHVTLLTGYAADSVEAAFGDSYRGMRLSCSREPIGFPGTAGVPPATDPEASGEPPSTFDPLDSRPRRSRSQGGLLGTGGALRLALPLLDQPSILLLNGDSYCDVDISALVARHHEKGAAATLSLAEVPDGSRYGRVERDAGDRITRFVEKGGSAEPGWINAGVYVFDRSVIEAIPPGRAESLERDVLPLQVELGRVVGFPAGRFIDIGTPESFAAAEAFFASGRS
jgi:D-glycero-alpha-D-manno-heptose 1-phosphate guanylyltransferase